MTLFGVANQSFDPLVATDSAAQQSSAPANNGAPVTGPLCPLARSASSAEHALHGLRFIHKATETSDQQAQSEAVKERFHKLKNEEGLLPRQEFCVCIGISENCSVIGKDMSSKSFHVFCFMLCSYCDNAPTLDSLYRLFH
ncbi:unnamed protein product [Calypogeia fissa]